MGRGISYLQLIIETIFLATKYKIFKNILSFDRYINYKGSRKKPLNKDFNINKIIIISSKICKILMIRSCLVISMTQKSCFIIGL